MTRSRGVVKHGMGGRLSVGGYQRQWFPPAIRMVDIERCHVIDFPGTLFSEGMGMFFLVKTLPK